MISSKERLTKAAIKLILDIAKLIGRANVSDDDQPIPSNFAVLRCKRKTHFPAPTADGARLTPLWTISTMVHRDASGTIGES